MTPNESEKAQSGPVIRLADFLSHFAAAGGQAAQACARESKKHLMEFFDQEEGVLRPRTVKFETGGRTITVPLFALAQPSGVRFSRMQMQFSASVDVSRDGEANVHNHKGLLKRTVDVDVTLEFDATDNAEAIELIRERLNRELSRNLDDITVQGQSQPI